MATITEGKTYFIPIPGFDHILAASSLMHNEMEKVGSTIAAVAKATVAQDTGDTFRSIEGGAVFEGGTWTAKASAGTPYAPYVEFGPPYAQPFMRPALDAAMGGR